MDKTIKILIDIAVVIAVAIGGYLIFQKVARKFEEKECAEFARDTITGLVGETVGAMRE